MENSSALLFDRSLLRRRRNRAAAVFDSVNFLKREAAERLAERLEEVSRDFPLAIDLGAHTGEFSSDKISTLIRTDMAERMLYRSGRAITEAVARSAERLEIERGATGNNPYRSGRADRGATGKHLICDEEHLPFAPNVADLITSTLSLHWVNDLPGTLVQVQRILKPDGLFLAVVSGARTLHELRAMLEQAEMECTGGISPHISPFVEVRDAGNLLMRAGFALPMADSESLTITYENMFSLLADLRKGGEANALLHRRRTPLRRDVLMRAAELYAQNYSDAEGRIMATVELVFLTGWKPHPSQPKPAKRGSGQVALGEFL